MFTPPRWDVNYQMNYGSDPAKDVVVLERKNVSWYRRDVDEIGKMIRLPLIQREIPFITSLQLERRS